MFERFWQAYPRKVSKGAAIKAWKALKPDKELVEKMLVALEVQQKWRKRVLEHNAKSARHEQIFLPDLKHPATWIRAMCWEDELPEIPKQQQERKSQKTMCATCGKNEGKYQVSGSGQRGEFYCIRCYDRAAHPENYAPQLRVVK